MADAIMTYGIVVGIFVFLTAVLFGSRAMRRKSDTVSGAEGHNKAEAA